MEERIYMLRKVGVLKYYTRSEGSPELYVHQEELDSRPLGRPSEKHC